MAARAWGEDTPSEPKSSHKEEEEEGGGGSNLTSPISLVLDSSPIW
jgi:hypothetical protein